MDIGIFNTNSITNPMSFGEEGGPKAEKDSWEEEDSEIEDIFDIQSCYSFHSSSTIIREIK